VSTGISGVSGSASVPGGGDGGVAGVLGNGGHGRHVSDSLDGVVPLNGVRDSHGGVDGGGEVLGDLLDGVGPGLVHKGLVDGLMGPHGAGDLLGAESGDVLEDGLGHVGGLDDGGGLVGGDGGGDVGVGGLGHGVGEGGDLGGDLGVGVGLGGGVCEVTSQPVVLDGGAVVSWGPDEGGDTVAGELDLGHGQGGAQQGRQVQEGVHGSC